MEKKKKRNLLIWACVIVVLAAFVLSPLFPYVRSLAVMSVYSPVCAKNSIMEKENFSLKIPSGEGWYPFVMTYTADEAFSSYAKLADSKLTIMYNFPAFDLKRGCSRLFDERSPYYNSFYGAYVISQGNHKAYGFSPNIQGVSEPALAELAKFDFFNLVLADFGLTKEERVFEYSLTSEDTNVTFASYSGWTCVCSDITINGVNHEKNGFVNSYLQYGAPKFAVSSDFAPIEMKSIVYAKFFAEWDSSVFFYVMSPSEEVCEECMYTILSQSELLSAK